MFKRFEIKLLLVSMVSASSQLVFRIRDIIPNNMLEISKGTLKY